jgi:hypothetical protein
MPAAVRTAAVTGSGEAPGVIGGVEGRCPARVPARCGFALAPFEVRFVLALARFEVGFALLLAPFEVRGGFAACFPPASAFVAAAFAAFAGLPAPESRFALRFPGRELGRFPSTPPSSDMAGDSRPRGSGYRELITTVDTVERNQLVDWLVSGNSAWGRLTSLSVALVCTTAV